MYVTSFYGFQNSDYNKCIGKFKKYNSLVIFTYFILKVNVFKPQTLRVRNLDLEAIRSNVLHHDFQKLNTFLM